MAAASNYEEDVSITETGSEISVTFAKMEAENLCATPESLPTEGLLEIVPPEIGEIYYIDPKTGAASWTTGKLIEIIKENVDECEEPSFLYKVINLKDHQEVFLSGKEIAYMNPSEIRLVIGTRVLAIFRELAPDGKEKRARLAVYCPGIVAEPPSSTNNYRYLIFFDNGHAQYVDFTVVYLIVESSDNVWEDVPEDMQPVIRRFLQKQDCILMKLVKDETVLTKYNGRWWACTVMNIDCSLVQIFYDALNRFEWIYSGSDRLKYFMRKPQTIPVKQTRSTSLKSKKSKCSKTSASQTPGTSHEIMYFNLKGKPYEDYTYEPHICTQDCLRKQSPFLEHFVGRNPLTKPLLCGWVRTVITKRQIKSIIYKAPCGRNMRSINDVHKYLLMTKSDITVDLFDFSPAIRVLAEFNAVCEPELPDLSKGAEGMLIPVVNEVNNKLPNLKKYVVECVPAKNVELNLDSDLLCGCSCEDNCTDRTKCECWQQTIEGVKSVSDPIDVDRIGYKYRRLIDPVETGIYECNSKCQCGPTCLNRVVQHPVSLKLQVFMTHENTWAVRVLNDVPQGSFICCYNGTIKKKVSTKKGSNKYSMKLNFLESVEKLKDEYETSKRMGDKISDDVESTCSDYSSFKETQRDTTIEVDETEEESVYDDFDMLKYNIFSVKEQDDIGEPSGVNTFFFNKGFNANDLKKQEGDQGHDQPILNLHLPSEARNQGIYSIISGDIFDTGANIDISRTMERRTYRGSKGKKKFVSSYLYFGEKSDEKTSNELKERSSKCKSYYIDTTDTANVGKFLHSSGTPNVFVQYVFVKTRDPSFPCIAFFTSQSIRAGAKLVWNQD